LRPPLIGNPIIHNSGKSKPRYYLEEDKPVGVSSYTSIVPLKYENIQELLKLNQDKE